MFSERVFVLKNVRLLFTKTGDAKFMSHLDLTRFMSRIVRRANLDIWYTEGFNPHPYLNFSLPLPLGFEGTYEILDIRLNDDNADISDLPDRLNAVCPESVRFTGVSEPTLKPSNIAFALYEITFDDDGEVKDNLEKFLERDSIIAKKRTKKSDFKDIELKGKIKSYSFERYNNDTLLKIVLPAGPNDNINPSILLESYFGSFADCYYCYSVKRTAIYDADLQLFV